MLPPFGLLQFFPYLMSAILLDLLYAFHHYDGDTMIYFSDI